MGAPRRVVVMGWHGSSERNLRALGAAWQSLDPETDTLLRVPNTWKGLLRSTGWEQVGRDEARLISEAHRRAPRPWILHSFSNAGFWTSAALLEVLSREDRAAYDALSAVLLDSAPGFPETVAPSFASKYATMAVLPAILQRLGRPPRDHHWLLTPALGMAFSIGHRLARSQVAFMEGSLDAMARHLEGKAVWALYGEADALVPKRYVEAFLDRLAQRGIQVTRERFESPHVRHFTTDRSRYLSILRAALGA